MKLKLDNPYHKIGEHVWVGEHQVYEIKSSPKYVMYAPHWKLLYWLPLCDWFREGWEYDVERV